MRKKAERQPEDHILCPQCNLPYGFVRCRITLSSPKRNLCLKCAVEEEARALLGKGVS